MFRDLSQQLNFAATVSVLTLALFALSSTLGQVGGSGSNSAGIVTIAAPIEQR